LPPNLHVHVVSTLQWVLLRISLDEIDPTIFAMGQEAQDQINLGFP